MDPVLYEEFASAFTTEWNKLQAEAAGDQTARVAELARVKAQLEKLVDALCNGTAIGTIQARMQALDSRRRFWKLNWRTRRSRSATASEPGGALPGEGRSADQGL